MIEFGKIASDFNTSCMSLLKEKDNFQIVNLHYLKGTTMCFSNEKNEEDFMFGLILEGEIELNYEGEKTILQKNDYFSFEKLDDHIIVKNNETTNLLLITSMKVYDELNQGTQILNKVMDEIEAKDHYTKKHCERVTSLSNAVALKMNFSNRQLADLIFAAFFHDLGKIEIPDEMLNKNGSLNDEEFAEMRRHVEYSNRIFLETFEYLKKNHDQALIAEIILQHHERLDGSGYPRGLKSDTILLEAKIIAVCDSFDAMVTDRPYKKGKTKETALEELKKCSETLYDSEIVELLEEVVEEHYEKWYSGNI